MSQQPDELDEILADHRSETWSTGWNNDATEKTKQRLLSWRDTAVREARIDVRGEVKAKIEALDKLIMGAGEYHDDPYEYVVPLRHIKEYKAELLQFDLTQPIYKDKSLQDNQTKEEADDKQG